jgi:tetratricopeptide (TPR) repeat protein
LSIFGFFRRKRTEKEEFSRAVDAKDYVTIVKVGKSLLQKYPDSVSIINSYSDALIKLGKKEEAIKLLLEFAEKKIREEYYDIAVAILKKILKVDPFNIKALKLLVFSYQKKELFYEAFKTLEETYWRFKEADLSTSRIKELLGRFIEEQFHPLFYERFADILKVEGNTEEAFTNYVLAGNLYANLHNYRSALRVFLKAREIKKTENLDRQIADVIANSDKGLEVVLKLIIDNSFNLDFLKFLVDTFKATNKLNAFKQIVKNVPDPKVKYFLQALINFEQGEFESGSEFMDRLKIVDREAYDKLLSIMTFRHPEYSRLITEEVESVQALPEPEEILHVLDQVIDLSDMVSHYVEEVKEDRKAIDREIKQIETDGIKHISMAEAMIGLGKFDKAIESAKEALKHKNSFLKAAILITTALRLEGKFKEAIDFLMGILNDRELTEEQQANLKQALGEVYEAMGKKERALIWYREAYRILKDPDLKEKINKLEKEKVS